MAESGRKDVEHPHPHQRRANSRQQQSVRRGRSGRNQRPFTGRGNKMGFQELKKLQNRLPEEQLEELAKCGQKDRFSNLLMDANAENIDFVELIVDILSSVCSKGINDNDHQRYWRNFLNSVRNTDFWRETLRYRLVWMRREKRQNYLVKIPSLISNIITVYRETLQLLDTTEIPINEVETTVRDLYSRGVIEDDIHEQCIRLRNLYDDKIQSRLEKVDGGGNGQVRDRTSGDFRSVSIIPLRHMLIGENQFPTRPNKVRGKYFSGDEYLETQFNLLHADLLMPLRDAIECTKRCQQYKCRNERPKKGVDAYFYEDVVVDDEVMTKSGLVYLMKFPAVPLQRVKWETSRRLLNGALVVLSKDSFQRHMICGTVYQRDPKRLRNGQVDILLERKDGPKQKQPKLSVQQHESLQMVETCAIFEAYRHNLKRLQSVRPNEIPFIQYLLDPKGSCQKGIPPPSYLMSDGKVTIKYDISSLLVNKQNCSTINILESSSWPKPEDIGCNASQSEAIRVSLTRGLALIQGPPGTGKTRIGLKTLETLLKNRNLLHSKGEEAPILVLCYSNHALDQFLEGVLNFPENGIIRIGGRCENENILPFHIDKVRKKFRISEQVNRDFRDLQPLSTAERNQRQSGQLIAEILEQLHEASVKIMDENALKQFMSSDHYDSMLESYNVGSEKSLMYQWLMEGIKGLTKGSTIEDAAEIHEGNTLDNYESDDEDYTSLGNEETGYECIGRSDYSLTEDSPCAMNDLKSDLGEPDDTDCNVRNDIKQKVASDDIMGVTEAKRINDVWAVHLEKDRWRLYRYWLGKYRKELEGKLRREKQTYWKEREVVLKEQNEEDKLIFRAATVIGMTTTGAAKYHAVLQEVKPKVVIVEEAAEIFEAHIVTSLTIDCQHLILIGDHQQLRPTPAVYDLAKSYNLNISLFERLIHNGMPYVKLSLQYRMRPQISQFVRHFYKDLDDAETTKQHKDIKGVKHNQYFIDHSRYENPKDGESTTFINQHEATFLVKFCEYLILQGYAQNQISILAAYKGQCQQISEEIKKTERSQKVQVTTIDKFQGRENDIILLSLVRSNEEDKVGYLTVKNRISVALSRAKLGFYCIGNFSAFGQSSTDWSKIVHDAREEEVLGQNLPLVCSNHPDTETLVSNGKDFDNIPFGGCEKLCDACLECGHICGQPCHPHIEHKHLPCRQPCRKRICEMDGHTCPNTCGEKCANECTVMVAKTILPCGHQQQVKCGVDSMNGRVKCDTEVPEVMLDCGHEVFRKCSIPKHMFQCPYQCDETLKCGHRCKGSCSLCKDGHIACKCTCGKLLPCTHPCTRKCQEECGPCNRPCEQVCRDHDWRCNKKCSDVCVPCNKRCKWKCKHKVCTKKCGELCDRGPCLEPCSEKLPCGHFCSGFCGDPCPDICCACNKQPDEEFRRYVKLPDCGHTFTDTDLDHYVLSQWSDNSEVCIQQITCPNISCGKPIQNCYRYRNKTRQISKYIWEVNKKLCETKNMIRKSRKKYTDKLHRFMENIPKTEESKWQILVQLKKILQGPMTPSDLKEVKDYLQICEFLRDLACVLLQRNHVHAEIVTKDIDDLKETLNQMISEVSKVKSDPTLLLGKCHKIRLRLQIDAIEEACCRRAIEVEKENKQLPPQSTVDEICKQSENVQEIRKTLKEFVWQLDNTILDLTKLDEAIDQVIDDNFGNDPWLLKIPGRDRKLYQVKGSFCGRWWKCPKGHLFPEAEISDFKEKIKCPDCKKYLNCNKGPLGYQRLTGRRTHTADDTNSNA
ncbi:NFX1-type zinc finger-containing protein 1-like [Ptychodera flava]|uniref:NFX1-type zinc finger-containing protein 1-like n=1 Tax=Ptychodera flava TaxID=63121 RepID=UPI00396A227F